MVALFVACFCCHQVAKTFTFIDLHLICKVATLMNLGEINYKKKIVLHAVFETKWRSGIQESTEKPVSAGFNEELASPVSSRSDAINQSELLHTIVWFL